MIKATIQTTYIPNTRVAKLSTKKLMTTTLIIPDRPPQPKTVSLLKRTSIIFPALHAKRKIKTNSPRKT